MKDYLTHDFIALFNNEYTNLEKLLYLIQKHYETGDKEK